MTPSPYRPKTLATVLACALISAFPAAAQDDSSAQASAPVRPQTCAKPEYPPVALAARAQGTTILRMTIGPDGKVISLQIDKAAGPTREHKVLDRAAAEALARCQFKPDPSGKAATTRVEYVWRHGLPDLPASQ